MDTSLIINAVNGNKKVSKAVTNINPEKDNSTLKTFAQMVNGLTANTYVDATRINKQSVNEEQAKPVLTWNVDPKFEIDLSLGEYIDYSTIEGGVRLNFEDGLHIDVTAQ